MAIVLEGPDNAGKTTLAQALQSAIPCHYVHAGGPPASSQVELDCLAKQQALFLEPDAVLDRVTCVSQSVYNPSESMDPIRRHARAHMVHQGVLLVFCRPSTDRLMRTNDFTWRVDEPDELKQKIVHNQQTFVMRYDHVMAVTPHVHYNFEEPGIATQIAEMLVDVLKGDLGAYNALHRMMHMRGGIVG
jgi:hypothetical protein